MDDVVSLEVYKSDPYRRKVKSVNQVMIENGYAEQTTESFLSKVSDMRLKAIAW